MAKVGSSYGVVNLPLSLAAEMKQGKEKQEMERARWELQRSGQCFTLMGQAQNCSFNKSDAEEKPRSQEVLQNITVGQLSEKQKWALEEDKEQTISVTKIEDLIWASTFHGWLNFVYDRGKNCKETKEGDFEPGTGTELVETRFRFRGDKGNSLPPSSVYDPIFTLVVPKFKHGGELSHPSWDYDSGQIDEAWRNTNGFPGGSSRIEKQALGHVNVLGHEVNTAPISTSQKGSTTPIAVNSLMCIASPIDSNTDLQVTLDYACGYGGVDCSAIQPGGSCYNPNSICYHASYAFSQHHQKNHVSNSCNSGGTAVIPIINPITKTELYLDECSSFQQYSAPCFVFLYQGGDVNDLDKTATILVDKICQVLLKEGYIETIIARAEPAGAREGSGPTAYSSARGAAKELETWPLCFEQWDPGGNQCASCISWSLYFQQWDPGGRVSARCFLYLHLEDKVSLEEGSIDRDIPRPNISKPTITKE